MRSRPIPLLLLLVFLIACGASSRRKSLEGTLATLNAASDVFLEVKEKRETAIVEAATSREEAVAGVEAFRKKSAKVLEGLRVAYRTLIEAALADDSKSIAAAAKTGLNAAAAVKELAQ